MVPAKRKLTLVSLCAMVVFCCAPTSLALYVGCNPDIHMDIPGVVANDFHIEGRIQSGERLGNWSDPPVLVLHIDGKFTKFTYSITPDQSDPDQNWFIFRADWSGAQYKYCEVLHLGLLFDVRCHNVAVDLVGWWTLNGQPIRIPGVPPPPNGGAVPIPGFEVFDMPAQGHQVYRIRNDSHLFDGAGGAKPGIDTEIVQLELISLTKDQLEKLLGSLPGAFGQLRLDGAQANLPWVPVENRKGPISEKNPQEFPADSFFDVFCDISIDVPGAGQGRPRDPTPISPGGFLLARVRLRFVNNAGEPDFRWVWHLHEAHAADLGDAPDSSNSWGPAMTAYPKGGPAGVQANYPTVFRIGSPPYGPIHFQPKAVAYLGQAVTLETEADLGPDADGINNLDVPKNMPDLDKADDGVAMPLVLPHCQQTSFKYLVTVVPTLTAAPDLYVNVWFDWNRDGDWSDIWLIKLPPPAGNVLVPEWAVQNQQLSGLPPGLHTITTPQFVSYHDQWYSNLPPIWMRINISEQKWQPTSGVPASGGCGPPGGYRYGETEDYYFTPEVAPRCAPAADGKSCLTVPCPDAVEQCLPTKIRFDYNKRPYEYTILSCDCVGRDTCHVAVHPSGASAYCVGGCPTPTNQKCELFASNNGDGTIDYECRCSDVPAPRYEFGDAPEGALAYPPLGVIGAFPTCRNVPTAGWIQHTNPVVRFGPAADLEPEGNAGNCPLFDPNSYDADECFGDGDAGLIRPAAYTITGPLGSEKIVPCSSQVGSLGTVCTIAKWGPNLDIHVTDTLVTTTFSYVNVLIDWDQNGIWGGSAACATAAAPEHVLVDFPVPNGYSGPLSALNPPPFLIGPKAGYVWARFTVTERRIGKDWTGEGIFEIGETEDYLLRVDEFVPPDLDFGDALETRTGYPTTLANDGARHVILPGFCLGNTIDREPDGLPDANALGDDNTGIDDEDGIVFLSPLIVGLPAVVEVRSTIPSPPAGIPALPAYLEGWIDFNGDNSWAEAGDQVFFNTQVPPGVSTWTINVPATATPGIKTYARFRYSTNANGHGYKGLANDGEVEDYIVSIEPAYQPGPPVEHLKWSQPPVEIDPMSKTPLFCGWDEPSFYIEPSTPTAANPIPWSLVADDFRCIGTMPITSVHWWGSYERWDGAEPPGFQPIGWRIAFWSNIAATPNRFSHPGKPLWEIHIPALRIQQGRVAVDQFPQKPSETCFDYYVQLKPEEYFWQPRLVDTVTADSTFWVSITAVYPNAIPITFHPWGWKTRPWHWMDDAVRFQAKSPDLPDLSNEIGIEEITGSYCGSRTSFDMAFELDTDPNYIKWEQPYTGLRNWAHYEDEKSMAVETTVVTPQVKHAQMPDLTETGVDVDATMDYAGGTWKPQILADDFPCDQTGPLTDITIWGSWYHDLLPGMPPADGSAVTFTLSIYSDIPAKGSPTGYSMPGELLWRREFQPGQFSVKAYARDLKEGYFVPCSSPPYYEYPGDSVCWQYDFHIDSSAAFRQTGTTAARKVYWLAVEAQPTVPTANPDRPVRFGWKTSLTHWNDDAVWDSGSELPRLWKELRYPDTHRYKQQSIDLAFQVGTQTETQQLDIQRQVADDWQCKGLTPVTAIVWWGSYIGYRYQACDCKEGFVPPQKPDYFLMSIWSDVPANADQPYSHPGKKLWEYKAYQYDEVLVGYDKHPEPDQPGAGHEPVLRYSVRLPQANWFHQKEQRAIYWLSIVAVYKQGNEPRYAWGWTNHKHAFNDDAVAGYYEPAAASPLPLWVWKELFDQTGASEDMSFLLFTEPGCLPSWYSTYNDWLTMGKPECWCAKPFGSGYQCDGDADGKDSGGLTKFRVFTGDLALLVNNWQKKINDPTLNPCADIDHKDSGGLTKFRVFTKDLGVLVTNWQKKDAQLPGDCPRPE